MLSKPVGATIAFLMFYTFIPVFAQAWPGKVVDVLDGDTIKVLHKDKQVVVSLYGIDTPEKEQAFGQEATNFTAEMVSGKIVDVNPIGKDRYGQIVGLISLEGFSLNEELVRNGFAWVDNRYCTKVYCYEWKVMETLVREDGIGLWKEPNPQAPWSWILENSN